MDFNVMTSPDFELFYIRTDLEPKPSEGDSKTVFRKTALSKGPLTSSIFVQPSDLIPTPLQPCSGKNRFEAKNMIINSL